MWWSSIVAGTTGRYCWKYILPDNVPGPAHFCTFIARPFSGLLFGWNRIPVGFEFAIRWMRYRPFSADIPKKVQLSQDVVKHIESGNPEHWAIFLWQMRKDLKTECTFFQPRKRGQTMHEFANRPKRWRRSAVLMWFRPPPSPLWIYHTLRLGHNNFPPEIGRGRGDTWNVKRLSHRWSCR